MSTPPCPHCQNLGWVRVAPTARPGEPGFGRLTPCVCQPQAAAAVPTRLQAQTFATFTVWDEPDPPDGRGSNRLAFQAAWDFAAHPQGWLVFTGLPGGGKTHLLAAIAHAAPVPYRFTTAPDCLDELRAGFETDEYTARFTQLRTVPLLLLDDLGAEVATAWAAEKFFQLLNYRYNWALPTVIATNLTLPSLEPRLASRLRDRQLVREVALVMADLRQTELPPTQS